METKETILDDSTKLALVNLALEPQVTMETIKDFLFASGQKPSDANLKMFFELAKAHNLNPFKREIYMTDYNGKVNFITGYQVYIQRAQATKLLNGWKAEATYDTKTGALKGAKVTIFRKDFEYPFEWEASLREFKKSANWNTMPEFMIKKVAICQAFRLCFPEVLGGMLYTREEIEEFDARPAAQLSHGQRMANEINAKIEATRPQLSIPPGKVQTAMEVYNNQPIEDADYTDIPSPEPAPQTAPVYADEEIKSYISDCRTVNDLKGVWDMASEAQQAKFKQLFADRKAEVKPARKKTEPETL